MDLYMKYEFCREKHLNELLIDTGMIHPVC